MGTLAPTVNVDRTSFVKNPPNFSSQQGVGTSTLLDTLNPLRGSIVPGSGKRAATFFATENPHTAKKSFTNANVATVTAVDFDDDIAVEEGHNTVGTVNYGKYLPHHVGFSWEKGTKELYTVVITVESGFNSHSNLRNVMQPEVIKEGCVLTLKTQMPDSMMNTAVVASALKTYLGSSTYQLSVMVHAFKKEITRIKSKMGLNRDVPLGSVAEIQLPYACEPELEETKVIADPATASCILVITLAKKVAKSLNDYDLDIDDIDPDLCFDDDDRKKRAD